MPHSSGGGSHSHAGGGHHHSSGSHSRGSSGGRSVPSISSHYKKNSSFRYVYYRGRRPRYIYSDKPITKSDFGIGAIFTQFFALLLLLPFIGIGAVILFFSINVPKRIDDSLYNHNIVIEDNLNVINDQEQLLKSLEHFESVTGIAPAIVTVSNDEWRGIYGDLENYAFDRYVNLFNDEKHWLIVYSSDTLSNGFDDWYFHGMQGDDTDRILTVAHTEKFDSELESNLLVRNRMSIEEAFATTFDDSLSYMMKPGVDGGMVLIAIFWSGCCIYGFIIQLINAVKVITLTTRNPKAVPMAKTEEEVKRLEITCKYCGGIYLINDSYTCPHCGGVTTFDENGNYN